MLKYLKIIILSLFIYNVYAQDESILPAQKNAIQTLAKEQGFSDEDLNNYIFKEYGININDLTKNQAISIILLNHNYINLLLLRYWRLVCQNNST
jgi:hypothetical protein